MQDIPKIGFSKKEAARATSLSVRSLDYLISRGELQAVKCGRRIIISAKSLARLVEKGVIKNAGVEVKNA